MEKLLVWRGTSALLVAIAIISACDSKTPVEHSDAVKLLRAEVSPCGGFTSDKDANRKNAGEEEKITWTYDRENGVFSLLDSHANLNCCGERSIGVEKLDGVIVIVENDQPGETGRCRCICLIDFALEIEGVSGKTLDMRLEMTVDAVTFVKWSGTVDLTAGSGELAGVKISPG